MLGIRQQTGDRHSAPTCTQCPLQKEGNASRMSHHLTNKDRNTQVSAPCAVDWTCGGFGRTQTSEGGEGRASRSAVTGEPRPPRGLDVHLADLGGRAPRTGSSWSRGWEAWDTDREVSRGGSRRHSQDWPVFAFRKSPRRVFLCDQVSLVS